MMKNIRMFWSYKFISEKKDENYKSKKLLTKLKPDIKMDKKL